MMIRFQFDGTPCLGWHQSKPATWLAGCSRCIVLAVVWVIVLVTSRGIVAQQDNAPAVSTPNSPDLKSQTPGIDSEGAASSSTPSQVDEKSFTRWLSERDALSAAQKRAWEFRPYRVAVWLCLDGSPQLSSALPDLIEELNLRAEVIDPSGWNMHFGEAPSQFRMMFLEHLAAPEKCVGFEKLPVLGSYDKLMVVCLSTNSEALKVAVRECDLTTLQWGPIQYRQAGYFSQLASLTMRSIQQAFMPLSRIERVELKAAETAVFLKVRAVESCRRLVLDETRQWKVAENVGSPVFIQSADRFLPVIRHTDREGKLLKLQPLESTFLQINKITDDRQVICRVTSSQLAPMAGRRSRTAERLALVIRPTSRPTTLVVKSRDASKTPVNGIKIYSTKPTNKEVEFKAQKQEYLGKTDWQGRIEIPPHPDGIRMLVLGRGGKGLLRLPIIPGLFDEMTVDIPNDEASLYADGVFRAFESEILNLIIQRDVLEAEINSLLQKDDVAGANEKLKAYRALESPNDLKFRLASEKTQLEEAATQRQRLAIQKRFEELSGILSQKATVTREMELQSKIQVKSNVPGAVEIPETKQP
jgi:hypothetical protein